MPRIPPRRVVHGLNQDRVRVPIHRHLDDLEHRDG